MSLPRLRLENCIFKDGVWHINGEEAHHLLHVRRCYNGSMVEGLLGDGQTAQKIRLRIECSADGLCAREIGREEEAEPEPKIELLLALLKNDQFDAALRFCAETGVYAVHLLICERSVPRFSREQAEGKLTRWRRISDEATKQASAARAPLLHEPVEFGRFDFDALPEQRLAALLSPNAERLRDVKIAPHTCIAVGPEGDWSPHESETLLNFGFTPVTLGKRIMRASTAVCAAAAAINMLYKCEARSAE